MDLPKNVTQIGEADEVCKIYVEDYVVSYLKQLNPLARDKTMAAALYGKKKTEENVTYLFVYGAGKLDFIQKETKHLSQAQRQEIERIRRQYFTDYEFLGYRILDGGMVDGFHVCEQDCCRYVEGYAQFYEKNEAMLSYMLESRQTEAMPESVESEKYDAARSRQEKRREKYARHGEKTEEGEVNHAQRNGLRVATAFVLVLLCALGIAVNSPALRDKGFSWEKLKADLREKKLPEEVTSSEQSVQTVAVAGNAEARSALEKESVEGNKPQTGAVDKPVETGGSEENDKNATQQEETLVAANGVIADDAQTLETKEADGAAEIKDEETKKEAKEEVKEEVKEEAKETAEKSPAEYVVKRGDTLTGISIRTYGSEKYVGQICKLNNIKNPDEIQEGQKILLP